MAQLSTPEPVWQGRSQSAPKRAIAVSALDTNGPFYKVTAGTFPLPTALAPQVQVLGVTVQLVTILALGHRNVHVLIYMNAHATYNYTCIRQE